MSRQQIFNHEAHEDHEGKTSPFKTLRGLRALRGEFITYASKDNQI
jgi:hypothetical protein